MNILNKMLTLWIYLLYPKIPSQQRWFIRFRYLGYLRQFRYFVRDYIIKRPYKVIRFEGEFQQELLHVIPFAYWHYKNGTLLKTVSSKFTKDLYFFSENHHEDASIIRSHFGNESLEIPNAPHDTKLLKLKWARVPFSTTFKSNIFRFEKEVIIIANRFNTEWGKAPVSFFDLDELEVLIRALRPSYQIIYNRPRASEISNDNSIVLELNDEEWLRKHYPDVIILSDLGSKVANLKSYNHLQLLVYSHSQKFISIHGGTATLASMFGGVNFIYSREGHEHALNEFQNVFPELSGCKICVFKEKEKLFNSLNQLRFMTSSQRTDDEIKTE